MEQRCHLSAVWLTWVGVVAIASAIGWRSGWIVGLPALVIIVIGQRLFIPAFPRFAGWMGYGSVEDVPSPHPLPAGAIPRVTLYTASVCPFCPIVRKRLLDLQRRLPFELEERDVTFQPGVIRSKGFRSVPVLEVGERRLVGNATSAQICALLSEAAGGS